MADDLTRRRLLGTGAAAGAALALGAPAADGATPAAASKKRRLPRRSVDVVVVGAGLSGLTAAADVLAGGRSVLVLEARDRVGGRLLNHEITGGEVIEAGGAYIGPTQNRVMARAKTLGVETFKAYAKGENVYVTGNERRRYTGTIPPVDPTLLADVGLLQVRLNEMAAQTPVDAPWQAARAYEWDSQTFDSWLKANSTQPVAAGRLLESYFHPAFGGELRDLSLLFLTYYLATSGDERNPGTFDRSAASENGAQDARFVGGSQLLATELARRLGRKRVVTSAPVRRVVQASGGAVTVVSDRGSVRARHVIVAVPPTLASAIDFRPALPPDRDALLQRLPMGRLMKCDAIYPEPFWRAEGLSGMGLIETGPIRVMFDNSPPDGSPGVLLGFLGGGEHNRWAGRPLAQRRQAVLEAFAKVFGPKALKPIEYFEMDWAQEPWTRGGPVALGQPGALTAYGEQLRRPFGRVHWAGTETATYWTGYMDGAVRAGERAAFEVLSER